MKTTRVPTDHRVTPRGVVRVPLTPKQHAQFQQLFTAEQTLKNQQSALMAMLIAGTCDPEQMQGWSFEISPTAIVCTPPAPVQAPE